MIAVVAPAKYNSIGGKVWTLLVFVLVSTGVGASMTPKAVSACEGQQDQFANN